MFVVIRDAGTTQAVQVLRLSADMRGAKGFAGVDDACQHLHLLLCIGTSSSSVSLCLVGGTPPFPRAFSPACDAAMYAGFASNFRSSGGSVILLLLWMVCLPMTLSMVLHQINQLRAYAATGGMLQYL